MKQECEYKQALRILLNSIEDRIDLTRLHKLRSIILHCKTLVEETDVLPK